MIKLPKQIDKNVVLNIIIIIAALIVANNIYKFQSKGKGELEALKADEMKKNEKVEAIIQLGKKINDYKELVGEKDVNTLLDKIGDIAKASNVEISSITPAQEQAYSVYTQYPFNVSCGADSYHAIGKFISNLENNPDIYIIDKVDIRPNTQGSTAKGQRINRIKADLKINAIVINMPAFKE